MEIAKNFEPNGEFEKHNQMIEQLRSEIIATLTRMKFDEFEQIEVIKIIDTAQARIREIARGLVGSNINNNPKKATEQALKEITKIINSVPKDVKKQMEYLISVRKVMGEI